MVDIGLWISYILFAAAIAGMIVYSIINMFGDVKKSKGALIGVGLLAALFLVGFLFASSEVTPKYEQFGIGPGQSKMIGAGLIVMYILGVATVVIAVYAEFRKIFMK